MFKLRHVSFSVLIFVLLVGSNFTPAPAQTTGFNQGETANFAPTPTSFIPITGNIVFSALCSEDSVLLNWQVANNNLYDISFTWWVVGGTVSGGPIPVSASSAVTFMSPAVDPLPNELAIMWLDPTDNSFKSLSNTNQGEPCGDSDSTTTSSISQTPGVLVPVTGIKLPDIFKDSMFTNLGIGIFGFALILLGIGIKLDNED